MRNAPRSSRGALRGGDPSSPHRSLPAAADTPPVTGTVRIRVEPTGDWPHIGCDVHGHTPPGLAALVDLGTLRSFDLGERTLRGIAWATCQATRVTILGDDGSCVDHVTRNLPAALAEAREMHRDYLGEAA